MPPKIQFLTEADATDIRFLPYRNLQDRQMHLETGQFIAESELIVRKLLHSELTIQSILLTAPRLASLDPLLASTQAEFPVLVVPQSTMDSIAGFHVHRGCLAIANRPTNVTLPPQAQLVVVLVDLVDTDNLGSMARNAAAFGADALILSPRCADPFYRKAVRTSAGAVLTLPILRCTRWPEALSDLRTHHGFSLVGAALDPRAIPLSSFSPFQRNAILFGSEGPGLDEPTKALCDALVSIPMAKNVAVDSLNVSTAGAVFLYHLTQGYPR
jgi:tRNA G18 (ribose-2'-O)-methylase SpoU